MKLEKLLNTLIQRGWKPFGKEKIKGVKTSGFQNYINEDKNALNEFEYKIVFTNGALIIGEISLRELLSKESGLWQFLCKKGMLKKTQVTRKYFNGLGCAKMTFKDENVFFWLIESALQYNSELDTFLLNAIKID